MLPGQRRQPLHQFRAACFQIAIDLAVIGLENVEGRQRRRHALHVAVIGAAVHHALVEQRVHDVPPTGDHGEREARGDRLCIDAEIGCNAELALRAAQADAKPGDDLVANEERAVLVAQRPNAFEIARRRRNGPAIHHDGFHDHGGNLTAMALQGLFQKVEVVPGAHGDIAEDAGRHAGRTGDRHRRIGRPRLVQRWPRADIGLVAPAVIVALELQDLVAAGKGARQTEGHEDGFRARGREANHIGTRQESAETLRQFGFAWVLRGEELSFTQ